MTSTIHAASEPISVKSDFVTHTQLCHALSVNFTSLSLTCNLIAQYGTQLCQKQLFRTQLFHTHLSHTQLCHQRVGSCHFFCVSLFLWFLFFLLFFVSLCFFVFGLWFCLAIAEKPTRHCQWLQSSERTIAHVQCQWF